MELKKKLTPVKDVKEKIRSHLTKSPTSNTNTNNNNNNSVSETVKQRIRSHLTKKQHLDLGELDVRRVHLHDDEENTVAVTNFGKTILALHRRTVVCVKLTNFGPESRLAMLTLENLRRAYGQTQDWNNEKERKEGKKMEKMEKKKKIRQHQSLVRCYGYFKKSKCLGIVTEYHKKGDLYNYLKTKEISEKQKFLFFVDMSLGIQYLHSRKIFDRDIKTKNYLVTSKTDTTGCKRVVISSFGLIPTKENPTLYLAPEISLKKDHSKGVTDIYSLGITMFELLTEKKVSVKNIQNCSEVFEKMDLSDRMKKISVEIIENCVSKYQDVRPTINDIVCELIHLSTVEEGVRFFNFSSKKKKFINCYKRDNGFLFEKYFKKLKILEIILSDDSSLFSSILNQRIFNFEKTGKVENEFEFLLNLSKINSKNLQKLLCFEAISLFQAQEEKNKFIGLLLKIKKNITEEVYIDLLEKTINGNFKNEKEFFNLGLQFFNNQKYKEAIEMYEKAIKMNPNYANAYSNLGNVYKKQNKFKRAIKMYKKAIKHKPNNSIIYNNVGSLYDEIKKYDKAIQMFKKAIFIEEKVPFFINLSIVYEKNQKYDEAIKFFGKYEKEELVKKFKDLKNKV